ncbi:MAG: ATP-binding cassette domain-containing protein, partial [Synechococcales bacterium]|nr:ATP-binding cassette domain-containing protein [Synechococcales bacterium]
VGSSGAGKSTLLQLLNTTLTPTQGEMMLLGLNVRQVRSQSRHHLQRQVGMIYQQFHLVESLKVIHNVNAGHLGRWSLWKALVSLLFPLEVATARQALVQVGIPEKLFARTDTLSGGQQQRVAIARVLVQDPVVILADEPIASLDPTLSQEVMELLCQLCDEKGRTLVVSLHDVQLARRYCDRMIGLRQGQILFDVPSDRVTDAMMTHLYQLSDGSDEMLR